MKAMPSLRSALPLALLALAACSAEPDEPAAPAATETPMPVEPDGGIGDGAPPLSDASDSTIPEALQGRWGLAPADCTSTRGDAKGLITVEGDTIRFYESRGTVETVEASDPEQIHAQFAFTGEGQEWTREMQWSVTSNGTQLLRTDLDGETPGETLTYTRCQS